MGKILQVNTPEQFWATVTTLANGCMEGGTRIYTSRNRQRTHRCCAAYKCLADMLGEGMYHRAAYRLAYPDVDIKNKALTWKCQNPACCNPEHLIVSYDRSGI